MDEKNAGRNSSVKRILGITGGVGCGKSTVLDYLEKEYGALCLLCDDIARELQRRGGGCYEDMLSILGESFLDADGEFDRKKVAQAAFADPALLERINACVHPAVMREVNRRLQDYFSEADSRQENALAVIEAALLIESGYGDICDEMWYIYAPETVRIQRLMTSRGYTEEKCRSIFKAQKPEDFYRIHTALTIDNGSDRLEDTYSQIDRGLLEHGFLYNRQRKQR